MTAAGEMKITGVASWFGSNRTLAENVGEALGPLDWCGVGFAGSMCEVRYIKARTIAVNDKHEDVIRLAGVIKNQRSLLEQALAGAIVHPTELAEAQNRIRQARMNDSKGGLFGSEKPDPSYSCVDRARDYFVVSWMSRSALGGTDGELNSNLAVRWDAGGGDTATRFRNACDSLKAWEKALQCCWFTTIDVFEFVASMHTASVRLNEEERKEPKKKRERRGGYFDPPFPDAGDAYSNRFTEAMHRRLAREVAELAKQRVRVVMRFHVHPLIEEIYPEGAWEWRRLKGGRDMHNNAKPEVLLVAGEPC